MIPEGKQQKSVLYVINRSSAAPNNIVPKMKEDPYLWPADLVIPNY